MKLRLPLGMCFVFLLRGSKCDQYQNHPSCIKSQDALEPELEKALIAPAPALAI